MEGHYAAARQHEPWTPAQDARLRKMIKDGKNSEEIAIELGRTRAAIMGRKQVIGITQKITAARGSKMPYTAYDKKRRTDTGNRNSHSGIDLKGALEDEAAKSKEPKMKEKKKSKPVEVKIDSKKIAKEAKKVAKDAVEKFRTVGKSVEKLFTNAKKNGLKVTITIGNDTED
jgi:hypothetical protein